MLLGALAVPAAADVDFGFRRKDRPHVIGFGTRSPVRRDGTLGHYRIVCTNVWVPGRRERVWRPARYGWCRGPRGILVRRLVRAAGYVTVFAPGHYETIRTRVWVPGRHR
ncbi:MAG TPA: hypothetical protein VFY93_00110 [Planctomycetota bacterium]|nr:hypothetical protein [Planctomycetota bacterium]